MRSLRGVLSSWHFHPALPCRAFPCRRFATGFLESSFHSRRLVLPHLLGCVHLAGAVSSRRPIRIPAAIKLAIIATEVTSQPQCSVGCRSTRTRPRPYWLARK